MHLYLVAVGRLRSAVLREACDGYAGRIRRYQDLEIREVKDAGRRAGDPGTARRIEGEALEAALPTEPTLVGLTRRGVALDSRGFAERLGRWRDEARTVAFLIGGAWGLDAGLLERVDFRLSLSTLTLPHELARLVLLEQVYRACTILKGEPYHKG